MNINESMLVILQNITPLCLINIILFFRSLVGGVINKPAIDSSGDIHEFCQNLKKLCLKNDVTIKTDTGVKEILTEGYGKK